MRFFTYDLAKITKGNFRSTSKTPLTFRTGILPLCKSDWLYFGISQRCSVLWSHSHVVNFTENPFKVSFDFSPFFAVPFRFKTVWPSALVCTFLRWKFISFSECQMTVNNHCQYFIATRATCSEGDATLYGLWLSCLFV